MLKRYKAEYEGYNRVGRFHSYILSESLEEATKQAEQRENFITKLIDIREW